ncbi:MAG: methylmalonyl-CoA mutase [Bdellovibrionales bacterium GWB1_55_8]|nr:MAG: methylmalonyl-CoA mutase [Bdellovibrionales bacterium GWB1_55_8]
MSEKSKETPDFATRSGIAVKPVYRSEDWSPEDPDGVLGNPGEFPFTRGVQKDMYRGRHWTMRQYAGFGTAEESNRRYRYLLSQGTTGLSVAFDLPTQLGYDPDHPRAKGEVGKVGVSVSTLDDMRILFDAIDLSKVSTSMTINATAAVLLAMYVAVAEEKGVPVPELRGTVQNDVLKEYVARGNYIYPPEGALRLATDMFAWCSQNTPRWNPISISGYHIREAGSTAVQELAFTFANAIAYTEAAVRQGLSVDQFAGQLSFFFNVHSDFFEEIAKFRAARRIWAKIMKERFGAKDPRSCMLRFHSQTAGSTLTAQQPQNNVVRVALQAMAAVLGGTQSLHTNSLDEALALPTEASARLALRTQQVIANETNVTQTVDPLGGSWYLEKLTDELEERARRLIDDIEKRGGTVKCIESGFIQGEIASSAYLDQKRIDQGVIRVVGVNCFNEDQEVEGVDLLKVSADLEVKAVERLRAYRSKRSAGALKESLNRLEAGVKSGENLQQLILLAVKSGATLGEVSDSLRKVFGVYQEYAGY